MPLQVQLEQPNQVEQHAPDLTSSDLTLLSNTKKPIESEETSLVQTDELLRMGETGDADISGNTEDLLEESQMKTPRETIPTDSTFQMSTIPDELIDQVSELGWNMLMMELQKPMFPR